MKAKAKPAPQRAKTTKRAVVVEELEEPTALEQVLEETTLRQAGKKRKTERIDGVVIGRLTAFAPSGAPLVEVPDYLNEPVPARATCALEEADLGREVALMFEGGKPHRPIVMGLLQAPRPRVEVTGTAKSGAANAVTAKRDAKRLVLEAEEEIVLKCGDASITLTRAGKVLIKGAYLSSKSSGVNRILGGSVLIN
jgi:hypothetical protein